MKIIFIVPTNDLRRFPLYRWGSMSYGHMNSISGPLILAEKFKEETNAKVIIGGIHASAMPEEALKHSDQVVVGEAENVILDLVEGRNKEKIIYAEYIKDLDKIPFPDYSLLKTPFSCANVMTTRGCPFSCSFCSTSRMFYPYRKRSIDNIIKELKIYKKKGIKYMNFEDDNFTADKERTKQICRRMIDEDLVFKETFYFGRIDMAEDEEMLQLLEKANLNRVLIGVETLNQESLDMINKNQNTEDIEKCVEVFSKYKIRLIVSLVLGIDGDDEKDIKKGVEFAKRIKAYQLQPAILTPLPGTPLFNDFIDKNRMISLNWDHYDFMNVTFKPKKMSPWELQKQFYISNYKFYTFFSSFKIWKKFDFFSGMRRIFLSISVKIGYLFALFASNFIKNTHLYNLRHKYNNIDKRSKL